MFWRLPIVRHLRWLWYAWQVNRHYAFYESLGYYALNSESDREILRMIWRGEA